MKTSSPKTIVIGGSVTGGASAAARARRLCEDCEIIIPLDREIIAHCQSGQRSYNAARILSQHGFRARNLTGAYRPWRATQPE